MWTAAESASYAPGAEAAFFEAPIAYMPPPAAGEDERLLRLRLIRSARVGPATYLRLLAEHGSARAALDALPEVARAAGVARYEPCPEGVALAELRAARRAGARMICLGDPDYPEALAEVADAPPVLWAMGDAGLMAAPCVAVIGTRNASSLGARMARRLAADLGAAGFTIVSGLARGIDALAHHASLPTGTIAVLAGGVDVVYPPENADLAAKIAASGLRLSEQPMGLQPQARHFPRRNRIVSGLSRAVIVVEAASRSGSLITARMAADQGREVMAVPGHPMDSRASGGNQLLRDGATLVRSVEDVIEALGQPALTAPRARPLAGAVPGGRSVAVGGPGGGPGGGTGGGDDGTDGIPAGATRSGFRGDRGPRTEQGAGGLEGRILAHLGPNAVAEDQLIRDLGVSPREMGQALAILEMAGRVTRSAGGMVQTA